MQEKIFFFENFTKYVLFVEDELIRCRILSSYFYFSILEIDIFLIKSEKNLNAH